MNKTYNSISMILKLHCCKCCFMLTFGFYIKFHSCAKNAFAYKTCMMYNFLSCSLCSRSVDVSTYPVSCRDQCNSPKLTHSFLLCKYPLPPSTGSSLKAQSHTLSAQLLAAEDLTPLTTPMVIEEG